MSPKMLPNPLALLCAALISTVFMGGPVFAEEKAPTIFPYLQKEPTTLFDIGMKNLRRLALDATQLINAAPDMVATSNVRFKSSVNQIEIFFHITIEDAPTIESLRQHCIKIRKDTILKLFRIGLTDYTAQLPMPERIRRRIGVQFAHEPIGSIEEALKLGDRLAPNTFVAVKLETKKDPAFNITCRALATDSLNEQAKP